MTIHAVDVIDVATTGLPTWRCACGRHFWNQKGFDRHLKVSTGELDRPRRWWQPRRGYHG